MSKKRGLGRGLGDIGLTELLGEINTAPVPTPVPTGDVETTSKFRQLPVDKLKAGRFQPRKQFSSEKLQELAESIKAQGIIQPLVVRHMNDGYEIIAGERRWRAAQLAGLDSVPAIVRDLPDEAVLAIALIENIQRRNLNAIEESEALQRLITEFQMTHQEVADAVGKNRTVVTNLLRLQKLNPDVKALVVEGHLEMGHARTLLALEGEQQSQVANLVVARALSVRSTEELVRKLLDKTAEAKTKKTADPDIMRLQNEISDILGATIAIQHGDRGKGKLVIHYNSVDELEGILEHIR